MHPGGKYQGKEVHRNPVSSTQIKHPRASRRRLGGAGLRPSAKTLGLTDGFLRIKTLLTRQFSQIR